jgi:hypothetical protein
MTHSTEIGADERLVVRPKVACHMLDVGLTRLYELIGAGEIDSFKDAGARKITTESIRRYIAHRVELAKAPRRSASEADARS